jgi:cytochrome P450
MAVEEILRWTSTNAYVGRNATRDVVIGGTTVRAGDKLTLWNAAANRDEEAFTDPDRFDVGRSPNHHMAFGVGVHRCIGQAVARQEITILFDHLRERAVRLRLDGPVERLRSNFLLGVKHMPVSVVSARTGE